MITYLFFSIKQFLVSQTPEIISRSHLFRLRLKNQIEKQQGQQLHDFFTYGRDLDSGNGAIHAVLPHEEAADIGAEQAHGHTDGQEQRIAPTTFAWKGLSLSAQFSWMADRWVMNNDRFFEESNGLYSTYNQSRRLLYDRWKKPGDITDIPRYGVTAQLDDRFLENSSFLRLKNLTLAYALPQPLLKKTNFFTSARVYLQGQNLLTFTGFTGLDPEMSSNIYRAQYPASRQFTLGIEVSF